MYLIPYVFPLLLLGFQDDIKRDELGPERNSAELRIKKSHVSLSGSIANDALYIITLHLAFHTFSIVLCTES